jgi:hypothetical protein
VDGSEAAPADPLSVPRRPCRGSAGHSPFHRLPPISLSKLDLLRRTLIYSRPIPGAAAWPCPWVSTPVSVATQAKDANPQRALFQKRFRVIRLESVGESAN